jgi:hypothetical protein
VGWVQYNNQQVVSVEEGGTVGCKIRKGEEEEVKRGGENGKKGGYKNSRENNGL